MSAGPSGDVTVHFDLSRDEYLEGSRALMRRQWLLVALPVIGVLLIVAGLFTGAGYLAAGVVLVAGCGWLWWGAPRQRWRRDPAQAGPFTYHFDDGGITIVSSAGRVELPWTRVRKVVRSRRLLLIAVGGSAVSVPWRAVADTERERLESLLRTHVS